MRGLGCEGQGHRQRALGRAQLGGERGAAAALAHLSSSLDEVLGCVVGGREVVEGEVLLRLLRGRGRGRGRGSGRR